MIDYEPYVSEPAEHPPRRRLESRRATVALLALLVLAGGLAWLVIDRQAAQDPALEVPIGEVPAEDDPRLSS